MNKRQFDKITATLTAQLEIARGIVAAYDAFISVADPIADPIADAWNAAHDMVTALEAHLRQHEIDGYGRRLYSDATAALIAANID